jgi:hypothetical protein
MSKGLEKKKKGQLSSGIFVSDQPWDCLNFAGLKISARIPASIRVMRQALRLTGRFQWARQTSNCCPSIIHGSIPTVLVSPVFAERHGFLGGFW